MTMSTVTQLKTRVERWAEKINAAHGESVQAIIEVGRQLQQAKAECSHGEWGELTGRTNGKPLLPFSFQTAHRFQAIAANDALSNVAHGRHFPASWRTLAVLASLDPEDIESAIADGAIHPEMQRKDAEALKAKLNPPKPPSIQNAPATVLPLIPPPLDDTTRAAIDDGLKDAGQRIADFAERQDQQARARDAFRQQPDSQAAIATYRDILSHLEAADQALQQAQGLAFFDAAFWEKATAHAQRILQRLEKMA